MRHCGPPAAPWLMSAGRPRTKPTPAPAEEPSALPAAAPAKRPGKVGRPTQKRDRSEAWVYGGSNVCEKRALGTESLKSPCQGDFKDSVLLPWDGIGFRPTRRTGRKYSVPRARRDGILFRPAPGHRTEYFRPARRVGRNSIPFRACSRVARLINE